MLLSAGFVIAPGLSHLSAVQAQDGRYRQERRDDRYNRRGEQQRNNGYGQVNPVTGNIDDNGNGIDDRYETRDGRVDINRNGVADQDENYGHYNNRRYGNDRYGNYDGNRNNRYGNYGSNSEEQRGYQDGLRRGREAAQTRRIVDPNNSEHFRRGSAAYREGFRRGFYENFRQYSSYRSRW